jgi:hypothetical protein
MADLERKGDLAELRVAADLIQRGHRIAIPYGEDCDDDLVVDRDGHLERVQVKHVRSDGEVVVVKCLSHSLTAGRVRAVKRYTAATVDWIAVWDATTDRCFYFHSSDFDGRSTVQLRLAPARNGQMARVRWAEHYLDLALPRGRGANGNTSPLQGEVGGSIPPASTA